MLHIYRTIFAEKIEDINFDNFGNHWSFDSNFKVGFTTNGRDCSGQRFQFSAYVSESCVNEDATMQSNSDCPNEYECVTIEGTDLQIELIDATYDEDLEDFVPRNANTGNVIDSWVNSASSDMNWQEFISEIKEWNE